MKICAISDLHDQQSHYADELSRLDAEVLVVAGDLTNWGDEQACLMAITFLNSLKNFTYKLIIAGNHDFWFEKRMRQKRTHEVTKGMFYLHESGITIQGRHFWGSPYTEKFGSYAFMYDPSQAKRRWSKIPDQVDVLITHGPPKTILDTLAGTDKGFLGCPALYERVKQVQPIHHVFGHIHSSHGQKVLPREFRTCFSNVSLCNDQNKPTYAPTIIEL